MKHFNRIAFLVSSWLCALLTVESAALATSSDAVADEVAYVVRYEDSGQGERQLTGLIQEAVFAKSMMESIKRSVVEEVSWPKTIAEEQPIGPARIVELRAASRGALNAELERRGVAPFVKDQGPDVVDEVVTLVSSGDPRNRIDVVFMGDGYTESEREKFFSDMRRLVGDMFEGTTFKSYLPVFNVYAVFRPSRVSGIGRNDTPRDTAYRLYRQGNTLRAIFPGNPAALRSSCSAAPGCDYPVVIANDPHYGGLGGEFAISTSSETSGTVVLRHELGHNFGRVGEEYDGGGYFGANWAPTLSTIGWRHWLTQTPVRAEPKVARFLAWPWHNLSGGAYIAPFRSVGGWARSQIRFSASGVGEEGALSVTLNGQPIEFNTPESDDRHFHTVEFPSGFSAGENQFRFEEKISDGNNWVSNLSVHEYAADFNFDPDFIGAFPVHDRDSRVAGYRSNNETCLMRNMLSTSFCKVCQENNWMEFFARVKVIDSLTSSRSGDQVAVSLQTLKLGQFRTDYDDGARIDIKWFRDGAEVPDLAGKTEWTARATEVSGRWEARVQFVSPEIRSDPRDRAKDSRTLNL